MSKVAFLCAQCGTKAEQDAGAVNRSKKRGGTLYCGKSCAGIARRTNRSDADKRALKAEYDRQYRARDPEKRKAEKAEYYRRTHDPVREAEARKKRMPKHVEYCRRPEYRQWKVEYDKKYTARKGYGPFGEAAIILNQLEAEISSRATWIDIRTTNGTLNKHQQRRRDYERQTQRR